MNTRAGSSDLAVRVDAATAVRATGTADPAGFWLLRDANLSYRDGAEDDVLRIISSAGDRSSHSDEMLVRAKGWAQRYHLDPTRANIVRGLDLPPDARVLEIGAGCGAVTRYLGERCAVVDALEPVPVRAAAAAARTADLAGVRVLVGELDDVPDLPVYDVIVVIGVLEYVGTGSPDRTPYLEFLRAVRSRLVDGGTLVLAIENRLGVKYLAGSPEDHTDRVFDSLESYPDGSRARTFSRRELESLMTDSGLLPVTRSAFPDYKMTRAVLGSFPEHARSLLHRVPRFPSPDWRSARPRLVDEARLWQNLVEAGVEADFANSFLVLAGNGAPSRLWPDDCAGVFYSVGRRCELNTQTFIESGADGLFFRRNRVVRAGTGSDGRVALVESITPYRAGCDFAAVVAEVGVAGARPLLQRWLSLLDAALAEGRETVIDLVPHNLVVDSDGGVQVIDEELVVGSIERDHIVRRGIYFLTQQVTQRSAPARWQPCRTNGEVMAALGELAGLPADGSWIDQVIAEESVLQADIRQGPPADMSREQWLLAIGKGMRATVARRLVDQQLGERLPAKFARVSEENKRLRRDLDRRTAELARATSAVAELSSSRATAVSTRRRRAAARLLPRGTRRRAAADRLLGSK